MTPRCCTGLDVVVGQRRRAQLLGADAEDTWPKRPGTARDFGILDMAFACIVGAHLAGAKNQALEDYARRLSGQILDQTTPMLTAGTFKAQLEALAGEVAKITKRNPLDEVYQGPRFQQSHNDLFGGKVAAAAHAMEEAAPDLKKKFDDATKGLSSLLTTLKWVGIGGAILVVLSLAGGIGFGAYGRAKSLGR